MTFHYFTAAIIMAELEVPCTDGLNCHVIRLTSFSTWLESIRQLLPRFYQTPQATPYLEMQELQALLLRRAIKDAREVQRCWVKQPQHLEVNQKILGLNIWVSTTTNRGEPQGFKT